MMKVILNTIDVNYEKCLKKISAGAVGARTVADKSLIRPFSGIPWESRTNDVSSDADSIQLSKHCRNPKCSAPMKTYKNWSDLNEI